MLNVKKKKMWKRKVISRLVFTTDIIIVIGGVPEGQCAEGSTKALQPACPPEFVTSVIKLASSKPFLTLPTVRKGLSAELGARITCLVRVGYQLPGIPHLESLGDWAHRAQTEREAPLQCFEVFHKQG